MLQFAHQRFWTRHVTNAAILCVLAALSGCRGSNSGDGSNSSVSARTYSLGATISGLNSSGLVLTVNGRRQAIGTDVFHMVNELNSSVQLLMVNSTAVSVAAGQTTQGLARLAAFGHRATP